jgi:DNA-binding beta-propeller fold protein YncE
MVLDNAGKLVVCDRTGAVDVIDPPYTSISGTLGSGWFSPQFVSISSDNQRVYVSDQSGQVRVLQYPSGTLIHTINVSNGQDTPYGVVEWQNFGF